MFPLERPAILNSISRGIIGENFVSHGNIINLMSVEEMKDFAGSMWNYLWEKLKAIGSIISGIIAIVWIWGAAEKLIGTVCNSYLLYEAFGCSFKILGAIFSSFTHVLLRANDRQRQSEFKKRVLKKNKIQSKKNREVKRKTRKQYRKSSSDFSVSDSTNNAVIELETIRNYLPIGTILNMREKVHEDNSFFNL